MKISTVYVLEDLVKCSKSTTVDHKVQEESSSNTFRSTEFCVIPISVSSVEVLRSQLSTCTAQQVCKLILGHLVWESPGMEISGYANLRYGGMKPPGMGTCWYDKPRNERLQNTLDASCSPFTSITLPKLISPCSQRGSLSCQKVAGFVHKTCSVYH